MPRRSQCDRCVRIRTRRFMPAPRGVHASCGIVKQSGGYVWVYSEPGQGTTFKIYLPRIAEAVDGSPEAAPTAHEEPVGTETVLVVEDDEAVRGLTREVLQRSGYRVFDAGNPREAIQWLPHVRRRLICC